MASLLPLPGALGRRRAAHLLRRTSYRFRAPRINTLAGLTAAEAVPTLLQLNPLQLDQPVYDDPTTTNVIENITWINPPGLPLPSQQPGQLAQLVRGWWVNEALFDPGIAHKMTFFYHQYMATSIQTLQSTHYFDYLALLRWGALGNFKKLAHKMIYDNVMLRYLNNNENTDTNPNENFAREFLELFTIGKGPQIGPGNYTTYTEDDIVQAARVFTGLRSRIQRDQVDPETGLPRGVIVATIHDNGPKTFSAAFQNTTIQGGANAAAITAEVQGFVNLVFAQPETARNLVRRLYRFFVHPTIDTEIENDIIVPLANTLIANDYEIIPVLQQLLMSEHFYDADDSNNADEIIGGMIKSPLELVLQAVSFFNVPIPNALTQTPQHYNQFYSQAILMRLFGMANLPLFQPADVAGYSAYYQQPDFHRQWFDSGSIIARYKLPAVLLTGTRQIGNNPNLSIGTRLDIAPWVKNSGVISDPTDSYVLVQDLLDYLLPEAPDTTRFTYFLQTVFLDNLPPADWTYEWQNYLDTNDDTEVQIPLERLVTAILYSPEYQTF